MNTRFRLKALALAFCLAGIGSAVAADTADQTLTAQVTTMDQLTTTQEPTKVTTKFASDFATFAGSQENAEALITGLRNGTPITLTDTSATTTKTTSGTTTGTTTGTSGTTTAATSTTITPPTKPMGYGNTYITMSLAKAQLAQFGITNPTPEQLNAVLTGGTFTTTSVGPDGTLITKTVTIDGILTQRASGMGWGRIAQANGFKLGQVISGMKSANKSLAITSTNAQTRTTTAATGGTMKDRSTAYSGKGGSHAGGYSSSGRGITTALGGGGVVYGKSHAKSGTQVASLNSHGAGGASHGQGAGIATAGGGAAAHGNAGGNSGNAGGHGKGPK